MRNAKLMTGVALAALLAGGSAAYADSVSIADIDQDTTNRGNVTNVGDNSVGKISGDAASASISATGAQSAVSVTRVNGANAPVTIRIGVGQKNNQDTTNRGRVTNEVQQSSGDLEVGGQISGNAASASVSATGAASVVGVTTVDQAGKVKTRIVTGNTNKPLTQTTTNRGRVSNEGDVDVDDQNISGVAASASVTAVGAQSAVSVSHINATKGPDTRIGGDKRIKQDTRNSARITNDGEIEDGGSLVGTASSATDSALGAGSSVSVANITKFDQNGEAKAVIGRIDQTAINRGRVRNLSSDDNTFDVKVGDLNGVASSASVSAVGAQSSISVANISQGNQTNNTTTSIGEANQYTLNTGAIHNTGEVSAGNINGDAASASVSAVGAASVVSVSNVYGY
jgi:hypothetical protein